MQHTNSPTHDSPIRDSSPTGVRRSRKALEVAGAIAFVGAIAFGASRLPDSQSIREAPALARALPVTATTVEIVEDYVREQRFAGEVRARRESSLGFDRIARVVEIAVAEGDAVREGDLLARLDTRDLDARRSGMEAALVAARAGLDELITGPRPERIDAAAARLEELGARLALAETIAERRTQLARSEAIALEELESAQQEVNAVRAARDAARAELAELEAGTRSEKIEVQRAEVARLESELRGLDVDLAESRLTAPFNGVVAAVTIDLGSVPIPGNGMIELVESESPEAWIGLPIERVAEVEDRGDVVLTIGGRPTPARFHAALPSIDERTRTRTVVLRLLDARLGDVVPGQVAELTLTETLAMRGVWIPIDGLVRSRRGLWAAYVLDPVDASNGELPTAATHRLTRREVEFLATDGARVLVRGDLDSNDLVLDAGAQRVTAGQGVRLLDDSTGE